MDPNSNGADSGDFLALLQQLESGGRNIPNTTQGTSSGQAQGYDQITTGTWNDFAPAAGVDLRRYPTPMSAPFAIQDQVARTVPMHRWDQKTLNGLMKAGYTVDPNRTLGENIALNGGNPGGAVTLNAVPEQDILGQALNPVAAGAVANAAAGIAPKAPPTLTPAPTALNQVPEQDILGQALAAPPASASVQSAPPMAGPPLSNPNLTEFRESLAANASGPGIFSAPGGGLDVMNGIPIAGPAILKAGAAVNALLTPFIGGGAPGPSDDFSDRYSNEVALQNQQMREYQAQHPGASMAANMAGGVLGAAPLVAAAPAAFGINSAAGLATNALAGAGTGAVLSGADAAARGGSPRAIGTSAAIGGGLGALAPAFGAGMNVLTRGLTGGAMATDDASLAALARDKYGIPLTNDQLAGAPGGGFLRSASDRLPFSGAGSDIANTPAQFNAAVGKTIGVQGATKLGPNVMSAAKTRIGSMFNSVAANTSIKADTQFDNDLLGVVSQAQDSGMTADELRPINKIFDSILDAVDPNTRTLSGSAYQTLTRSNTPFGRALSNPNPNISTAANEIKDALDDALGRSASPTDLQTFQDAKSQWRNLRTIEGNVAQNGGNVSAPRLASDLNNSRFSKNAMAYGQGGDLGELAAIGQQFMKQPPSSGTAERLAALGALGTVASGGNALLQGSLAGAANGLGFVPAALAVNRYAVNPLLRSQWLANGLINRSLPSAAGASTPSWLAATALGASTGRNALLSGGQ